MFLYLAECPNYAGTVDSKIGISKNPENRVKRLSGYCRGPVSLVKVWDCGTEQLARLLEHEVKIEFYDKRKYPSQREFFSVDPSEILTFVVSRNGGE